MRVVQCVVHLYLLTYLLTYLLPGKVCVGGGGPRGGGGGGGGGAPGGVGACSTQVSKKGLYSSVSRTHLGVAVRLSLRVALHLYHRLRHLLVARLRVARHRLSHGLRGHRLPHHLSTTGLRMGG